MYVGVQSREIYHWYPKRPCSKAQDLFCKLSHSLPSVPFNLGKIIHHQWILSILHVDFWCDTITLPNVFALFGCIPHRRLRASHLFEVVMEAKLEDPVLQTVVWPLLQESHFGLPPS
jgi:hypothetical protein